MIEEEKLKTMLAGIQADLKSKVDTEYVEGARRTIGDENVMGVRVPEIKAAAASFLKSEGKNLDIEELVALADECFRTQGREEQVFAVNILARRLKNIDRSHWQRIDRWIDLISNWETCDQLATQVAGRIVLKNIDLAFDLTRWTASENVWRRRFAAAATVTLNHGGHSHTTATFSVLRLLMGDNEDMVRKAVAWALREAGKADEEATFDFMMKTRLETVAYVLKHGSEKFPDDKRKELGAT